MCGKMCRTECKLEQENMFLRCIICLKFKWIHCLKMAKLTKLSLTVILLKDENFNGIQLYGGFSIEHCSTLNATK